MSEARFEQLMDHLVHKLSEARDPDSVSALARDGFVFTTMRQCGICVYSLLALRLNHFEAEDRTGVADLCACTRHGDAIHIRPPTFSASISLLRVGGPTCPVEWLAMLMHAPRSPPVPARPRDRIRAPNHAHAHAHDHAHTRAWGGARLVKTASGRAPVRALVEALRGYRQEAACASDHRRAGTGCPNA